MTVLDLVTQTLTAINAITPGESIAPEDSTYVASIINQWIQGFNAEVAKLLAARFDPSLYSFNAVADLSSSLTDVVTLPNGWARALTYNAAIDICPAYEKEPSAALVALAASSKAAILTPAS